MTRAISPKTSPRISPPPLRGRVRVGVARYLRSASTDAERHLWRNLRFRQLSRFKFRRQHPIGPYVVDFICISAGLVIEVDGGQHNEAIDKKTDAVRTLWLQTQGLRVLRFWNNEISGDMESVLERILDALVNHSDSDPHPNPPPGRGRENMGRDDG